MKRSDADVDLEALMLRLAAGDRSAFDPLYNALCPLVQRLCTRMMRGAPEADDAAQEAMMKVFARASQYEAGRSVTTWVLAITAYECRTLLQRQRRRREQDSPADAAFHETPEAAAIDRDLEAAAREVLGTLRAIDIETLDASARGARGEQPDLPQATFRKRLERALGRFRAAWSARHGND